MWLPKVATQYNDGRAGMQTEDLSARMPARMLHTDVYCFFLYFVSLRLHNYSYHVQPGASILRGGQYFAKGAMHQSGPSNN